MTTIRKNELFIEALNESAIQQDFCKAYLPKEIMAWLNQQPEFYIKKLSTKIVKPSLDATRDGDVLLGIYLAEDELFCLVAIEAQAGEHPALGVRSLTYSGGFVLDAYRVSGYRTLPPVISLVYNYGKKPLRTLNPGYHHIESVLVNHYLCFDDERIRILELSTYSDDELLQHGLFAAIEFLLKYRHCLDEILLEKVMQLLHDHSIDMRAICVQYFGFYSQMDRAKFLRIIRSHLEEKEVMTVAEQFREEAIKETTLLADQFRKEGKQEAIKETTLLADQFRDEGVARMRVTIARNLLSQGSTLNDVANATELSLDEVKQLQIESANDSSDA